MADKPSRFRLYTLSDVGADGAIDQQYVRVPSSKDDEGYWGGVAPISAREKTVGTQAEHVIIYDVTMWDSVPLDNTDDAVLAVLGAENEEVQFLKVQGVMLLRLTREKQARCLDVSDENWPDRLTA